MLVDIRRLLAVIKMAWSADALHRILRERYPVPGGSLCDLAGIAAFTLYLTTTFDPLLERTLNAMRYRGVESAG